MKKRIIVVDCCAQTRECAAQHLQTEGVSIECFSDWRAAVDSIRAQGADVVLVDMTQLCPECTRFMSEMKALNPFLNLIVMTSDASPEEVKDMLDDGSADVVKKPVDGEVMREAVRLALAKGDRWRALRKRLAERKISDSEMN